MPDRIFEIALVGLSVLAAGSTRQAAAPPRVHTLTGNVMHLPEFHSQILGNDRNVTVYLPPGYDANTKRRYPVLYMSDGQNVFDGATSFIPGEEWRCDEAAESLIRAKAIQPLIIVGIDNAGSGRIDEYCPTAVVMQPGGSPQGGKAEEYGKMLLQELKPMIDTKFRTLRDRNHTAVGGSSLGGLLSLYLGITHSEAISQLLVVSPSIWWDGKVILRRIQALPTKLPLKIWMDIGTEEPQTMVPDAIEASKALESKGWKPGKDLLMVVDYGGQHNEASWARRFPMMLMYLYRR